MDYKRKVVREYVETTQNAGQRYQLFRIIPLIILSRGVNQDQRIGDRIKLLELEFTLHVTSALHVHDYSKQENQVPWYNGEYKYKDKSVTLIGTPYNCESTGLKWDFVAPVPTDASGVGTQVPLTSMTTAVPLVEQQLRVTEDVTLISSNIGYYPDGDDSRFFNFTRGERIKTDMLLRMLVVKGNYIFDRNMTTGDLFFDTHGTIRNPYNGVNMGTNIPVASFIKEDFSTTLEVVWEKYFHVQEQQNTFYKLRVPVAGTECSFMEGFDTPTFNDYDIVPRTFFEPLRNNYYVILMSSNQFGISNYTQLFTEPTFAPIPNRWLIDLSTQIKFKDSFAN